MTSQNIEAELAVLLSKLTLEEKISLLAGKDFWSLASIDRLGIPSLKVSDGPTGLRSVNSDPSTVFPVGVALAATWDPGFVEEMSAAIGREAIAHGVDVLLAPTVNIQRTPLGGRNFECYSEDPHLSSEMGVAYVAGVQSEGVGTSLKHYAANNQEHERMRASSNVPARALNEIYLASFEPVIKRANPWTVMAAYNRVNGTFACEHDMLLNGVLKGEWGYDGVVVSDWGGTKSTIPAALNGLDLEMPGPARHFGSALLKAVENGAVSEAVIDEHALRLLRLIARCGLLTGNPKIARGALCTPEHRRLARKAAADSMVLLKNEGQLLPLAGAVRLAVIGAVADYPAIQGGGSSQVTPDRIITPLEGLRQALGADAEIHYERGIDHEPLPPVIDGRLLSPDRAGTEQGLRVRYFDRAGYQGTVAAEGIDWRFAKLGFGAAAQSEHDLAFSAEWKGFLRPRHTGVHHFEIAHSNKDVELEIDGATLIGEGTSNETELLFMILPLNRRRAALHLDAGKTYPITIRYSQDVRQAIRAFNIFNVHLREPAPNRSAAIEAARNSVCAVVFVGSGTTAETEGLDRKSMRLSEEQNALVEDILAVNPRTVVVVNTGAPVEMPWASRAPAIVQMWLPGQEGGHAIADVLTGAANPSGKLPVTFPVAYEDNPTFLFYPGGLQADYGEGLFVGYRYYDACGIEPLFPFGHGLSYSRFELETVSAPALLKVGEEMTLLIRLTNRSEVKGAETIQIYVENLATAETGPRRQLAAFMKAELEAGASETLEMRLQPRAFSWFDPDRNDWVTTPGAYIVHVGTSSRNLPIKHAIEIRD